VKLPGKIAAGLAAGAGLGIAASAANAAAAPSGFLAGLIAEAGGLWLQAAGAATVVFNAGCLWASAAVLAGQLAGTRVAGAVAGVLALAAATAAYYGTDAVLRQTAFLGFWHELHFWWAPNVVLGLLLGAIGSWIMRPGLTGLLAGLTVPVGAAVEAALLPRYPAGSEAGTALDWARLAIWAAAGTAAAVALVRAAVVRRRR
jgi:hypothetical protein